MKNIKCIEDIYNKLSVAISYYSLIIDELSLDSSNQLELLKVLKLKKKLEKNILKIEKYAKKERKRAKKLSKIYILDKIDEITEADKTNIKEQSKNDKQEKAKEHLENNDSIVDLTKSKSTKRKRLRLGNNIKYVDSVEFCDCTINNDINFSNEQIKFPCEAVVLISGTIVGYINIVNPKCFKIAKDTVVANDIENKSLKRITELKQKMYEEGTLLKDNTSFSVTQKEVELPSLLDAVTFLCGQKKTAFNGIEVKLKDKTGDEKL